ncbi:MAG: FG-GAP-like repeat-containing protein [Bacteroidales bacterium]|jgi:RHS repeat-associated protein|nr:FG-GAP-like repeat-containing protein [Bacteroidales bacterium]
MSAPSSIPYNPDLATTTLDYEVSDEASFARIRYSGNQFTVKTKEGKTLYYGGTPNALSKLSNGKIYGFLLRKIVDAWGNEVNYYYNNANGEEPSVSEIVYGGTTACKIIFDYDTRKLTRKYAVSAGNVFLQKKLLKKIRMQVGGMMAHAYNMTYHEPVISNSSSSIISIDPSASDAADFTTRLLSIQKEYVNVQDTTLTLPLTFTWSPPLPPTLGNIDTLRHQGAVVETDDSDPYSHHGAVADVNGDGIMDLIKLENPETQFLIDINGDGAAELITRTAQDGIAIRFAKSNIPSGEYGDLKDTNAFESLSAWLSDMHGNAITELSYSNEMYRNHHPVLFGDVNGDGLADVVGILNSGAAVYLNRGDLLFEKVREISGVEVTHLIPRGDVSVSENTEKVVLKSFTLQDMNGDGKDDLVEIVHVLLRQYHGSPDRMGYYETFDVADEKIYVYDALLDSLSIPEKRKVYDREGLRGIDVLSTHMDDIFAQKSSYHGGPSTIRFIDMNGDGLPDMLKYEYRWREITTKLYYMDVATKVYRGNPHLNEDSAHLSMIFDFSEGTPLFFMDVNGDGLLDLLSAYNNMNGAYLNAYLNTGFGFAKIYNWFYFPSLNKTCGDFLFELVDLNGDGLCEVIPRDCFEMAGWLGRTNSKYFLKGRDYSDGVIEKISRGKKPELEIEYMRKIDTVRNSSTTNLSYPYRLISNQTVVKSITTDGEIYRKFFTYGKNLLNVHGKGLLGYDKIETTTTRGEKIRLECALNSHNDDFLLTKKETYKYDSLLSRETYFYDTIALSSKVKYYPLSKSITFDGTIKTYNHAYYDYDSFGNVTRERKYTDVKYLVAPNMSPSAFPTGSGSTLTSYTANLTFEETKIDYVSSGNYGIKNAPCKVVHSSGYVGKPALADTTFYTYQNGLLLTEQKRNSTTTCTYNTNGLLSSETVQLKASGSFPQTTTYQYQNGGRFLYKTISPPGDTVTSIYDTVRGLLLQERNNYGFVTNYSYDSYSRQDTVKTSPIENETIYRYVKLTDVMGVLSLLRNYTEEIVNGNPSRTYRDALGRVVATMTSSKNGYIETRTTYNHDGLKNKEIFPFYVGGKMPNILYKYDVYGRAIKIFDDEKAAFSTYTTNNGYTTVETRRSGVNSGAASTLVSSTVSNAVGDIITSSTPSNTVHYVYKYPGLPSVIYDNSGDSTVITYDSYGRIISKRDGASGGHLYTYDNADRLLREEDNNGSIKKYLYDSWSRLQKMVILGSNADSTVVSYEYVADGVAKGSIKRVSNVENTAGDISSTSTVYFYSDTTGLLVRQIDSINDKNFVTAYTYYRNGNMKTKTFPGGLTISYGYNQDGSVDSVVSSTAILWKGGAKTAWGSYLQSTLGGSINHRQTFDKKGRLTARQTFFPNDTFAQYYDYDIISEQINYRGSMPKATFTQNASDVLTRTNNSGWAEVFEYDDNNRLKHIFTFASGMSQAKTQTTYYDLGNNISHKDDVGSYTYSEEKPHVLDRIEQSPLFLDNNSQSFFQGEFYPFTSEQNLTFTPHNRVKTLTQKDYKATFNYNASFSRATMTLHKNDILQYTKYYLGNYEEKQGGENNITSYSYIPLPDGTQAVCINDNIYYLLTDHLGSIVAVATSDSGIIERYNYDGYGRRRNPVTLAYEWITDTTSITDRPVIDRGFSGHEHLDEFHLINMNARLYDPWLGQFISPDPLADQYPGVSPYSYCGNNPINKIDPTGMTIVVMVTNPDGTKESFTYTPGMKYKGDNAEARRIVDELNRIYAAEGGGGRGTSGIMDALISSGYRYVITNGQPKGGDASTGCGDDDENESVYISMGKIEKIDAGSIELMAHELFHAYLIQNSVYFSSIMGEVAAYLYSYSIAYRYARKHPFVSGSDFFLQTDKNGNTDNNMGKSDEKGKEYNEAFHKALWSTDNYSFTTNFNELTNLFEKGAKANERGLYNAFPLIVNGLNRSIFHVLYPMLPFLKK